MNYIQDKRDFLFRFVPPDVRQKLLFDDESLYSTTDQLTAEKVAKDIARSTSCDMVITDATACVGGSAYAFSRIFKKVNAVELDAQRFEYLVKNMNALGAKVECVQGDMLDVCKEINQDIIFLDPPWGGPDYKNEKSVSLMLSDLPLSEVCRRLQFCAKYFAMKVPVNFDEEVFLQDTKTFLTLVHRNTQLRKMNLLIFSTLANETKK